MLSFMYIDRLKIRLTKVLIRNIEKENFPDKKDSIKYIFHQYQSTGFNIMHMKIIRIISKPYRRNVVKEADPKLRKLLLT